ncbi:hypothetical protein AAMO2058_000392100 [Amorphochlora amoebiformis]
MQGTERLKRELSAILEVNDLNRSHRDLERFFKLSFQQSSYGNAFREGFNDILDRLFGSLEDPTQRGWLARVGRDVNENILLRLFASKSYFFAALVDLSSKYIKGINVPWRWLPHPTINSLRKGDTRRISPLYKQASIGKKTVEITLLEYYFFRFMMFVDHRRKHQSSVAFGNNRVLSWMLADQREGLETLEKLGNYVNYRLDDHITYQLILQDYLDYLFPHTLTHRVSRRQRPALAFLLVMAEVWLSQNSPSRTIAFHVPNKLVLHSLERTITHLISLPGGPVELMRIQRSLFRFFHASFARWPPDLSTRFHEVVSIWLVYIQPWMGPLFYSVYLRRHRQITGWGKLGMDKNVFFSAVSRARLPTQIYPTYTEKWKRYMLENVFFYTILYRLLIRAASEMDLRGVNLEFLLRVFKVYQNNVLLREVLGRIERMMVGSSDRGFYDAEAQRIEMFQRVSVISAGAIDESNYRHFSFAPKLIRPDAIKLYQTICRGRLVPIREGRRLNFQMPWSRALENMWVVINKLWATGGKIASRGYSNVLLLTERTWGTELNIEQTQEDKQNIFLDCKRYLEYTFKIDEKIANHAERRHRTSTFIQRKRPNQIYEADGFADPDPWTKPPCSYESTIMLIIFYRLEQAVNGTCSRCLCGRTVSLRFMASYKTLLYIVLLGLLFWRYFVNE